MLHWFVHPRFDRPGFQFVGRSIALNGDHKTIIGGGAFNPAWLEWGPASAVFVPAQLDPNSADVGNYFRVFARPKPGITREQATAALRDRFPTALRPKDRDGHLLPRRFAELALPQPQNHLNKIAGPLKRTPHLQRSARSAFSTSGSKSFATRYRSWQLAHAAFRVAAASTILS
jgi:hypothetical protein